VTSAHRQIVDRFYAAVTAKDGEAIAAAIEDGFAPDAVMRISDSLPYGGVHAGREMIQALLGTLARTRTPMVLVEGITVRRVLEQGEEIAVDVQFPWIAPGAAEPIPMAAVEWFTFRDGRVVEMRVGYWDTAACLRAMESAATAPAPRR
jgi:ketosteroid isomerase-like protein